MSYRLLSILFIVFSLTFVENSFAARRFKVCVKQETGVIVVKRKCKAGTETQLDATALQSLSTPTSAPIAGLETVRTFYTCDAGFSCSRVANCPTGKFAISGGIEVEGLSPADYFNVEMAKSYPSLTNIIDDKPTRWLGRVTNSNDFQISFAVWAICADAS